MKASAVHVEKAYDEPFVILYVEDITEIMQRVKPTAVCVYLALATHANRKQANSCFPSFDTLAERSNVSRRTVIHAIDELEEAGIITVEHRIDPQFGQKSNTYFLHRTRGAESAPPSAKNDTPPVSKLAPPPVQILHPNHMNSEPDEGEPESPPVSPKPKRKQKTLVPDDFDISDRMVSWAAEKGMTRDHLSQQVERFVNNAAMKQLEYADWDRAFQNWMLNARDWGHLNRTTPNGSLSVVVGSNRGGKVGRDGKTDEERGWREDPGPKGWTGEELRRMSMDIEDHERRQSERTSA